MFEYDVPKEKFGLQACSDRCVLCLPGMGEGSCIAFGVVDARRMAEGRWGTRSGGSSAAPGHAELILNVLNAKLQNWIGRTKTGFI